MASPQAAAAAAASQVEMYVRQSASVQHDSKSATPDSNLMLVLPAPKVAMDEVYAGQTLEVRKDVNYELRALQRKSVDHITKHAGDTWLCFDVLCSRCNWMNPRAALVMPPRALLAIFDNNDRRSLSKAQRQSLRWIRQRIQSRIKDYRDHWDTAHVDRTQIQPAESILQGFSTEAAEAASNLHFPISEFSAGSATLACYPGVHPLSQITFPESAFPMPPQKSHPTIQMPSHASGASPVAPSAAASLSCHPQPNGSSRHSRAHISLSALSALSTPSGLQQLEAFSDRSFHHPSHDAGELEGRGMSHLELRSPTPPPAHVTPHQQRDESLDEATQGSCAALRYLDFPESSSLDPPIATSPVLSQSASVVLLDASTNIVDTDLIGSGECLPPNHPVQREEPISLPSACVSISMEKEAQSLEGDHHMAESTQPSSVLPATLPLLRVGLAASSAASVRVGTPAEASEASAAAASLSSPCPLPHVSSSAARGPVVPASQVGQSSMPMILEGVKMTDTVGSAAGCKVRPSLDAADAALHIALDAQAITYLRAQLAKMQYNTTDSEEQGRSRLSAQVVQGFSQFLKPQYGVRVRQTLSAVLDYLCCQAPYDWERARVKEAVYLQWSRLVDLSHSDSNKVDADAVEILRLAVSCGETLSLESIFAMQVIDSAICPLSPIEPGQRTPSMLTCVLASA